MKVMRHSHGVAREGGGSSMCVLEQRQSSGPSPLKATPIYFFTRMRIIRNAGLRLHENKKK